MLLEAEPRELVVLDQAIRMLEEATSLDEIRTIRDKAQAVRSYAKAAKLGLKAMNHAAEVKLLAERKAGGFLSSLKLRGGDRITNGHRDRLNLKDLGVSQNESKRWQKIAAVPEVVFRRYVKAINELGHELTAAGLMRIAKETQSSSSNGKRHPLVPSYAKAVMRRPSGNSSGPEELITDLNNHCQLLASLLRRLQEETRPARFEKVERRTVGRLLSDMSGAISQLRKEWEFVANADKH